jgi:Mu-like prophage major head subunit gpT
VKIPEHGEYPRAPLPTETATAQLGKYGRVLAFTREAMVNDDVGFFDRIPQLFGNAAASMESDVVYGILVGNPVLADGNALFSAVHGNLMSADTINAKSVGAARQAMLNQKSADGQFLSIMPRFLIVGPLQEVYALQFLAPITIVGAIGDTVPQVYRAMELVVDPRITDAAWYLAASPDQIDTIEYDYLAGAAGGGPTLETRVGWDIDGQEYKAREEFTATPIDWRGLVKNPGQLPALA